VTEQKPPETTASASAVGDLVNPSRGINGAAKPADAWLARLLSAGPVKVREIQTAAKSAGISMRTVERAKKRLGVKAAKLDMRTGWIWTLPDKDRHKATAQSEQVTIPTPEAPASPQTGPSLWQVAMVRNDYSSAHPVLAVPLWAVMGRK